MSGLLRSVFEAMVEGVVVQRRDGTIAFANPAAERILGLPLDQLAGLTSADPRWRAEHEDGSPFPGDTHPAMVALATGRAVRSVFMSVHKPDGTRALIEVNAEPVFESDPAIPDHVVATFVDVSERRASEARVRALAATVSDLYNHAPCGYHSLDASGVYLQINDTELEWLGLTRDEVVGRRRPTDFMTPESRRRFQAQFPAFTARGSIAELELEFVGPDGRVRTVGVSATAVRNADGTFVMSRSVAYDISELVRLRGELAKQHARDQQVLLDNDLVAVARLRDRAIVWANAALGRLLGFDPGELVGRSILTFHVPESAGHAGSDQMYTGSRQRTQVEMTRRDGTRLWVDVYEAPLGSSGEVLALIADLTPIHDAESKLMAAQRMESIGRLAGGVAHEFNNRLQMILGGAELALMKVDADDAVAADLRHIQTAARHAAAMTQQLMAYARKQPSTPWPMSPNDAVTATLAMVAPSIPSTIEVCTDLAKDAWPILMDAAQFTTVLTALLLNAREAIEGTGRIDVQTANVHMDTVPPASSQHAAPGDFVAIVVRDTGRGMTPEVAARAFEPFFTTKKFGQNSGLGLSTVHGSVAQHKGWVRLASAPGEGCTVSIYLPRAVAGRQPATTARREALHTRTVLLVEDDPGVQAITRAMLRRCGFDVMVAGSAENARVLFGASAAPVDLLVTDVVLPGATGVELADWLLEAQPTLSVVLISAYSADALAERSPAVDRFVMLPKPFNLDDLARAIARARERS